MQFQIIQDKCTAYTSGKVVTVFTRRGHHLDVAGNACIVFVFQFQCVRGPLIHVIALCKLGICHHALVIGREQMAFAGTGADDKGEFFSIIFFVIILTDMP